MRRATWYKVRHIFPYNLLVFQPRREFTIREIVEIAEKAGYRLTVHVEAQRGGAGLGANSECFIQKTV